MDKEDDYADIEVKSLALSPRMVVVVEGKTFCDVRFRTSRYRKTHNLCVDLVKETDGGQLLLARLTVDIPFPQWDGVIVIAPRYVKLFDDMKWAKRVIAAIATDDEPTACVALMSHDLQRMLLGKVVMPL